MKLLHVSASPRGPRSESLAIAGTFLDAFRETHPGVEVETWDLWDGSLPAFGPEAAAAKMEVFAGGSPTGSRVAGGRRRVPTGSPTPTRTSSASRCGTPASRTSSSS